jgi:hypothetical protein
MIKLTPRRQRQQWVVCHSISSAISSLIPHRSLIIDLSSVLPSDTSYVHHFDCSLPTNEPTPPVEVLSSPLTTGLANSQGETAVTDRQGNRLTSKHPLPSATQPT